METRGHAPMTELLAATGDGVARIVERDGEAEASISRPEGGARCLAVDPREPDTIYVGSGSGVERSLDGGATWERTALEQDVFSVALSSADGVVYAGCEPSSLFRSSDRGRSWRELEKLRELPSAPTWSFPPRPWTSHVRWVAPSPHDPDRLIVGIELGGLMLSEDGGRSWHDHRAGAQPDVHALAWHPVVEGRAYEAGGGGAAWSRDGGRTFEPADAGRDRHYTWALAVDPEDPDRWYVSASTGPFSAHGQDGAEAMVYCWEGTGPWRALDIGLATPLDSMPYALAASGARLYAGFRDGSVFASSDRGASWRRLELSREAPRRVLALVAIGGG